MDNFLGQLINNIGHAFQPQQSQGQQNQPLASAMQRAAQPIPAAKPYAPYLPMAAYAQTIPTHGQIPVGQSMTQQDISRLNPQVQQLAQIYNQNPMDARVAHIDPAIFGYAPDNAVSNPQGPAAHSSMQNNQITNTNIPDPLSAIRSLLGL